MESFLLKPCVSTRSAGLMVLFPVLKRFDRVESLSLTFDDSAEGN